MSPTLHVTERKRGGCASTCTRGSAALRPDLRLSPARPYFILWWMILTRRNGLKDEVLSLMPAEDEDAQALLVCAIPWRGGKEAEARLPRWPPAKAETELAAGCLKNP